MANDQTAHWNVIKKALGFRQPGNEDFVRWTENQKELYSTTQSPSTTLAHEYGLIVVRYVPVYSHPLLEIERGELSFATLVQQLGRSESREWTLIETVDYRQLRGWIETRYIDPITTAAYKLFKSEPSTRFTFLDAQQHA